MKIMTADWVLPVSTPPIADGAVVITGAEVIEAGPRSQLLPKYTSGDVEIDDLGRAAILPGFVNCHSHLELTAMRGAMEDVEHDFTAWLLRLNSLRAEMSQEDITAAAVLGAREGAAAGVTCFGDIGRMGSAGLHAIKTVGLRGISFQETEFSPDNRTADADLKRLIEKYEILRAGETDLVRVGMSPHSPYTVSSRLFEMLAQVSIIDRIPLTIHVAESAAEYELLTRGTGFFASVYEKYDVEWQSPLCTPVEYLERMGVLSAQPLLAHCVQVSDSDLSRIQANGAKIAHCPKSNAKFGHGYAPFEAMLDNNIEVGFGSDSVVSNNLCDLLEEGRFASFAARNRSGSMRFITPREILERATLGGARALGLDHLIGTLEPRKAADLVAISLTAPSQQPLNDVEASLVFSTSGPSVIKTLVAGEVIYDRAHA